MGKLNVFPTRWQWRWHDELHKKMRNADKNLITNESKYMCGGGTEQKKAHKNNGQMNERNSPRERLMNWSIK